MDRELIIERVGEGVEIVGVAVIVVGIALTMVRFSGHVFRPPEVSIDAYGQVRRGIGRSILLGLEVLVAGDIIRTVAVSPSFSSVGVLAVIVVIRTFLSFTLEVELTSRWPWQAGGEVRAGDAGE